MEKLLDRFFTSAPVALLDKFTSLEVWYLCGDFKNPRSDMLNVIVEWLNTYELIAYHDEHKIYIVFMGREKSLPLDDCGEYICKLLDWL
jgi:hypothetical protein